jgi:hypothetical protein
MRARSVELDRERAVGTAVARTWSDHHRKHRRFAAGRDNYGYLPAHQIGRQLRAIDRIGLAPSDISIAAFWPSM